MVKKQKEDTPNVNATTNRDIVQRLNFLYQASVYLQSIAPPEPSINKGKERQLPEKPEDPMEINDDKPRVQQANSQTKSQKRTRRKIHRKTTDDLARTYIQCMRVVGQKTTVKIDPSIKRTLCSGCHTTLIPGSSASVRVKKSPSHGHLVVQTCLHCRTTKRIPAPPNDLGAPATSQSSHSTCPPPPTEISPGMDHSSSSNGQTVPMSGSLHRTKARAKRKPPHPRPLPLFARPDAGHVVFRGNERLTLD